MNRVTGRKNAGYTKRAGHAWNVAFITSDTK